MSAHTHTHTTLEPQRSGWVAASEMTIADLMLTFMVKLVSDGDFDFVDPNFFKAFPLLEGVAKKVSECHALACFGHPTMHSLHTNHALTLTPPTQVKADPRVASYYVNHKN